MSYNTFSDFNYPAHMLIILVYRHIIDTLNIRILT